MTLKELLRRLRASDIEGPLAPVVCNSVIALEGYLSGYEHADGRMLGLVADAKAKIPGPDYANLYTRAYFSTCSSHSAHDLVLDVLLEVLDSEASPESPRMAPDVLEQRMVDAITQNRSGMFLGHERTVEQLANFFAGYLQGLVVIASDDADRAARRHASFDAWARSELGVNCPWWIVIRRQCAGEEGLRAFADLWQRFKASPQGATLT